MLLENTQNYPFICDDIRPDLAVTIHLTNGHKLEDAKIFGAIAGNWGSSHDSTNQGAKGPQIPDSILLVVGESDSLTTTYIPITNVAFIVESTPAQEKWKGISGR